MPVKVGILGLQGAVEPHMKALTACGAEPRVVRLPDQIAAVDALIIPGGESTTMGILMERFGVKDALLRHAEQGKPMYGTCAGMILMAKEIEGSDQARLGLMDTRVARNSFGRQVDSFEAAVDVPAVGEEPFRAVFIRAPHVVSGGEGVEVLSVFQERIVLVRQGHLLASAFHPELTDDLRLHRYFLQIVNEL
ncbi:MAG: pyridoxal 5'-phosphate synthase glutaminase subunit PdxT [Candidatus Poribacteria bacterium]|nr:pyridoxal 5'-phosphate synthase glutaminase subunit PdxT [Candidatus Poribacteria bacterium]